MFDLFFQAILQETNLRLPEVHYDTFEKAGFLQEMDETIKWALYVYCALKEISSRYGHTYSWLKTKPSLEHYKPNHRSKKIKDSVPSRLWEKVLTFLCDVKAIKVDKAENKEYYGKMDQRLFLHRYYWAELNIARNIKSLMTEEQDYDKCGRCSDCQYEGRMKGEEVGESVVDVGSSVQEEEAIDDDMSDVYRPGEAISNRHPASIEVEEDDKRDVTASAQDEEHGDVPLTYPDSAKDFQQELLMRRVERDSTNFKDDMDQHTAAKSIRKNPFTLIVGRGGCGKTHVVCEVLKEFCGASVVMAAPTGKAASNLRKKFEKQTHYGPEVKTGTLHQIIFSYGIAEDPSGWEYRDTDILVVDECSMVPVVLLSRVLKILLDNSNLKKLILLGDYRQLPAIDAGNLLGDLYEYFKDDDVCVELKTNHRTESEHIVNCAIKISNQEMPDLNASEEFCHIDLSTTGRSTI